MLLEGCDENKETINSVISKLYRKAEFDLSKAQRAIVFLDGMDKIGANANISENGRKQVNSKVMDESFFHERKNLLYRQTRILTPKIKFSGSQGNSSSSGRDHT